MHDVLSFRSWRHRPFLIATGVLGIALLLALANPHNATSANPAPPESVRHAPTVAMVAAHAITAGAVITATDLRPKAYDAAAPDGALLSREAALGRVAGRNFAAGEVLLADDLRDAAAAGIGARVPLGERAFSIRVVEDEIVGGFLQSGDHVDIFGTIPGSVFPSTGVQSVADRSEAVLLLQNVQVLAVGENPATRGSIQASARTVSLSLPPGQLARLTLALRFGKVSLAIRRPGDASIAPAATATLADLIPLRATAPTPSAAAPQPRGIPFYAGTHAGFTSESKSQ